MKTKMKVRLTSVVCMMLFASAAKAGNLFEISGNNSGMAIPQENATCATGARRGVFSLFNGDGVFTPLNTMENFSTFAIPMTVSNGQNLVGNIEAVNCDFGSVSGRRNESVGFMIAGSEQRIDSDPLTWDAIAYFPDLISAFPGRTMVGSALQAVNSNLGAGHAISAQGERLPLVMHLMKREKQRGCTYKNNDNRPLSTGELFLAEPQSCYDYSLLDSSLYSVSTRALPLPEVSCPNGLALNAHAIDMNEAGVIVGRVGCGNINGNLGDVTTPNRGGQDTQGAVIWSLNTSTPSGYEFHYLDRRDEVAGHANKSQSIGINNQGEVAGEGSFNGDRNPHAFVWKQGMIQVKDIHQPIQDEVNRENSKMMGMSPETITTKAVAIASLDSPNERVVAALSYSYTTAGENAARGLSFSVSPAYILEPSNYKSGFAVYGRWNVDDFQVSRVINLKQLCKLIYPSDIRITNQNFCKVYISGMNENGIMFGTFDAPTVSYAADMTPTYRTPLSKKGFIYNSRTMEFKEVDLDSILPSSLTRGMTPAQIANVSKEVYSLNDNGEMIVTWGSHYFLRTLDLFETLF